jgi:cadmium resistance protein CadD (predicted permease)
MTLQKLSKYAKTTTGVLYILIGVFGVGICLDVCLTDDRPKLVVTCALSGLVGLWIIGIGIKEMYQARRAGRDPV